MNLTDGLLVSLLNDSKASIDWVRLTQWFSIPYRSYALYLIAIPQAIFSLIVISILILGLLVVGARYNNGLMFLTNLALSDIVTALVLYCVITMFEPSIHYHEDQTSLESNVAIDSSSVASNVTESCKMAVSLWSLAYSYSAFATIILTVDRYISIASVMRYKCIMTQRKVVILIIFSWIAPILMSCVAYFSTGPDSSHQKTLNNCSSSHLRSKYSNAVVLGIVMIGLIILYILYSRIIFSFWKLKRKRSTISRQNKQLVENMIFYCAPKRIPFYVVKMGIPLKQSWTTIRKENAMEMNENNVFTVGQRGEQKSTLGNNIYEQLNRAGRYIKASKYEILILLLFTACWLPWVIVFYIDFTYHQAGYDVMATKRVCGQLNSTVIEKTKYNSQLFLCMNRYFQDENISCPFDLGDISTSDICATIHVIMHDIAFNNIQHLLIVVSALNSLFNPLVYALWYDDFRKVAKDVITKIMKIF